MRFELSMAGKEFPRLFIGSSSESIAVARGLKANLEDVAEVRIWDEGLSIPGNYVLEDLLRFTTSFDFAAFVWSADDSVVSRGSQLTAPRDNVILEAGLFYGLLGRERVFLCAPRSRDVKTPSDLLGLKIVTFQEPSDANYRAATGSAASEIASRIVSLGLSHRDPADRSGLAIQSYPNFEAARKDMSGACKDAQEIKISSNKGLAFFGLDDSLISVAEASNYSKLRRIRILLMDPESPWINGGFVALRHYESVDSYKKELAASHAIAESSMARLGTMINLRRSGIKYHTVEPYFRLVMTNDVAFVSSYAEHPSVQVRDLPVYAYRSSPGSLYWAFKRHFNDVWHNSSSPRPGKSGQEQIEVSAGGIVFATVHGETYVGLVQREDGSWVLPKGHQETRDKDLRETAVREVSEELGIDAAAIRVERSLDAYASGEPVEEATERKVVYFFVMQSSAEGIPAIRPDVDHRAARWWNISEELPYMRYPYQRTLLAEISERMYSVMIRFQGS
jgi:8-oxo-dGTP pyrophosphatase MutT (NUDIX family)